MILETGGCAEIAVCVDTKQRIAWSLASHAEATTVIMNAKIL